MSWLQDFAHQFRKEADWDKVEQVKQTGTTTPVLGRDISRLRQAHAAVPEAGERATATRQKGDEALDLDKDIGFNEIARLWR